MRPPLTAEALEQLAHKRAARKMGWYTHAFIFIVVNIGLAALSTFTGRRWAIFPAFAWGLGLLVHGVLVFAALPISGFRERLVQQERERLQQEQQQDQP